MSFSRILFALSLCLPSLAIAEEASQVIDSMDALDFRAPQSKGKVELVEGRSGKAVQFAFDDGAASTFAIGKHGGDAAWDKAEGFSFWVKGDGSRELAGLQLIWNEDYGLRYDYAFPIESKEWRKVTVAWRDLIPSKPHPDARPLAATGGNAPSKLGPLWFGKWWYWRDFPAQQFAIDDIQLEPEIEFDTSDYKPSGAPLARTLAKLQAGEPVKIATMGDSLTDFRHWANRKTNWPTLLLEKLKGTYKSEIAHINPARGGEQLPQGLVLLPRWSAEQPDLVTILYGYNDWEDGTRGAQFVAQMKDAVDRVRRATHGKSDVLVITSCPALERWRTMTELSAACRDAAADRNAGIADAEVLFHAVADEQRASLFVDDKVHLGPAGHALVAEAILAAIAAGGRAKVAE